MQGYHERVSFTFLGILWRISLTVFFSKLLFRFFPVRQHWLNLHKNIPIVVRLNVVVIWVHLAEVPCKNPLKMLPLRWMLENYPTSLKLIRGCIWLNALNKLFSLQFRLFYCNCLLVDWHCTLNNDYQSVKCGL